MKRSGETLVNATTQVWGIWEEFFKKLTYLEREYKIEIPHTVRRELEMRTITEDEAVGADDLSVKMVTANRLVGVKWLVRLVVCAPQ